MQGRQTFARPMTAAAVSDPSQFGRDPKQCTSCVIVAYDRPRSWAPRILAERWIDDNDNKDCCGRSVQPCGAPTTAADAISYVVQALVCIRGGNAPPPPPLEMRESATMAKKKAVGERGATRKKDAPKTATSSRQENVEAAVKQLDSAREQLRKAEAYYEEMKSKAAEQAQQLRETSLGDVVDGVLEFVQKHPGVGVVGAAALGFLLGRTSKR